MRIKTNGISLEVTRSGPSSAPCIVLAHGIATDHHLWDGVAADLSRSYDVVSYDARGHGGSDAPEGPYTLEMLGLDALGLLDAIGVERAHFVGLSMGGMVGLGLALDHPQRLKSLVVCDARASAPPEYKTSWQERSAAVRDGGIEQIVEPSVSRWFAAPFKADPVRMEAARAMVRRTSTMGYRGCAAALQDLAYGDRLTRIVCPTLYLVGSDDSGAPPAAMRAMAEATENARYVEIENAGHLSALEQPEAVSEAIQRFVEGVEQHS
jgi:3-oxoadipate enol-lactonase